MVWPDSPALASLIPMALVLGAHARRVPWSTLSQSQLTGWLGATTAIMLLWQFSAGIVPDVRVHLLGASALTLIAGRDKAVLGLGVAALASAANGNLGWQQAGLVFLFSAWPAVWLAQGVLGLSERLLPPNYFVYFFTNGFFGAGLSYSVGACGYLAVLGMLGAHPSAFLIEEALPFALLFSWSEAFLTGLVIAALVIWRPQWVESFDDARYLSRR
jgi:uncharacterized membrane protein